MSQNFTITQHTTSRTTEIHNIAWRIILFENVLDIYFTLYSLFENGFK